MTIRCTVCKERKPLSKFYRHRGKKAAKHGYCSQCKKCWYSMNKRSIRGTPEWRIASIKSCARGRHIEYSLTKEQVLTFWQKPCSYCGSTIENIGLDRVDYKKPYTIDNVVACCRLCNVMKFTLSPEEFLAHCRKIVEHAKTLGSREVA